VSRGGSKQQRRVAVIVPPANSGDALALDEELRYAQPTPAGGEVEGGVAGDVRGGKGVRVVLEDSDDDGEVVDVDCAAEAEGGF